MGKIEETLKSEIGRLVHKEVRPALEPVHEQVRALSRQVRSLENDVQRLTRTLGKVQSARPVQARGKLEVAEKDLLSARMSPGLIKKLRGRHGITQQQLAALVDVSAAAVQSWEQGIAKPTGDNRSSLVALRRMSTSDVRSMMERKGVAEAKRRPRTSVAMAARAAKPAAPKTAKKAKRAKTAKTSAGKTARRARQTKKKRK
ncbi:MAG: helix-turn-helix domain-containing protein [Planctomycetes bacterium]|nr:helix-turn-helix domain-containing protein [Planctomycetota bacterium]